MKLSWLNGLLAVSLSLGLAASAYAESVNVPRAPGHQTSDRRVVSNHKAPGHNNAKKDNRKTRHTYVNGRYVVNDNHSRKTVVSSSHYIKNVRTVAPAPVVVAPAPVVVAPAPAPVVVAPAPAPAPVVVAPAPAPVVVAPAPAPVVVAPAPAPVVVAPAPAPVVVAPAPAPVMVAPAPVVVPPPGPRPIGPAPAPRPMGPGIGPVGPGHHGCGHCEDIRRNCRGPECNRRFDSCMRDCRR